MARAARVLFAGLGAATASIVLCCSIYDPSLLVGTERPEAGSGIGFWSGPGDRGCFTAGAPKESDRPAHGSDKDVGPIYLAIVSMRLGSLDPDGNRDSNAWKDIGFDLDGVCTGSDTCEGTDNPPSCRSVGSQVAIDGNYCRDNTFGRLEYTAGVAADVAKRYGLSDDAFNCALHNGSFNYVIRISGYNGEQDDDQIRVDFYPSPGLELPLPWDCRDPNWKNYPGFTADDPFTVLKDVLTDPHPGPELSNSTQFDDKAFVRGGSIVVNLPDDTVFWFPGYKAIIPSYPLRIQKGIVSGSLARGRDGIWRINDGIIAGRARGPDLIQGFRLLGACESDDAYHVLVDFVNNSQDILSTGVVDPNAPCDAISVGVGYTAQQATAGAVATVEPLRECVVPHVGPEAGTDPFPDAGADGLDAGASDAGASDAGPSDAGDQ